MTRKVLKHFRYTYKNDGGFTLTEVMMAIVVLSVGLLGLAQTLVVVINTNLSARQLTAATTLAQAGMEEVHRIGYGDADTAAGMDDYGSLANFEAYKRVTTIETDTPGTGMKTATINVSWKGDQRSLSLSTILTE